MHNKTHMNKGQRPGPTEGKLHPAELVTQAPSKRVSHPWPPKAPHHSLK